MPEKPDPKRVAERLAGGSTVRKDVLKTSTGGSWVSQSITCPYCNTKNPAALKKLHGVVTCFNCHKEIRILDEEECETDIGDATKQIYDELVRSGCMPRTFDHLGEGEEKAVSFGFSIKRTSLDAPEKEASDKDKSSPDDAE